MKELGAEEDRLYALLGDCKESQVWSYYVFHGRVTLFFANNSLAQCRITMKFLHNFF